MLNGKKFISRCWPRRGSNKVQIMPIKQPKTSVLYGTTKKMSTHQKTDNHCGIMTQGTKTNLSSEIWMAEFQTAVEGNNPHVENMCCVIPFPWTWSTGKINIWCYKEEPQLSWGLEGIYLMGQKAIRYILFFNPDDSYIGIDRKFYDSSDFM